jgi:two-component system nitrogen regulation response regulator GlnG
VRELQGVIKEAIMRATGQAVIPEFLPASEANLGGGHNAPPLRVAPELSVGELIRGCLADGQMDVYNRVLALIERELVSRALQATQGHQAQASELLDINRTTLRNKLRELGISLDKVVNQPV